jgi:hypothetical protein
MSNHASAHLIFGFAIDLDATPVDRNWFNDGLGCKLVNVGSDAKGVQTYLCSEAIEAGTWGDPTQLDLHTLSKDTFRSLARLRGFCAHHGLEYKEPHWLLAAAYL